MPEQQQEEIRTEHPLGHFSLGRREIMILFCFYLSCASLTVADLTSVKLLGWRLFGYEMIIPAGTIAFAITYICNDVVIELSDKRTAYVLIAQTLITRLLILFYFGWAVGDPDGNVAGFEKVSFWTSESQAGYASVLSGSYPIYVAGFLAILFGFLMDVYVYSVLRDKQRGKDTFWMRNVIATVGGQIVNSVIFVTIAFGAVLTLPEILSAIVGQCVLKIVLAIVDPFIGLWMRNWGESRVEWWAIWKRNLRVDYQNYTRPN